MNVQGVYESPPPTTRSPIMEAPNHDPLVDGDQVLEYRSTPPGQEPTRGPLNVRFYRAPSDDDPIADRDDPERKPRMIVWARILQKPGTETSYRCETADGRPRIEAMRQEEILDAYNNFTLGGLSTEDQDDTPLTDLHIKDYAIERLHSIGIRGVRALDAAEPESLERLFGEKAKAVRALATDFIAAQRATETRRQIDSKVSGLQEKLVDRERAMKEMQDDHQKREKAWEARLARLEAAMLAKGEEERTSAKAIRRAAKSDPNGRKPRIDPEPEKI